MEIVQVRFLQVSGAFVAALIGVSIKYDNAIHSAVYPASFALFGFLYTMFLWKIFTPKHNYDGDWWGYTEHQSLQRQSGAHVPELPDRKYHIISFRQNPFEFRIAPSDGRDMNLWKSDALTAYPEGKLIMAYSVTRKVKDVGYPESTLGYAIMTVMKRNIFGMPTKLKGNFYHAAESNKNLFSGETVYNRGKPPREMLEKIKNE